MRKLQIDKLIQSLANWINKYPKATVSRRIDLNILKEYSSSQDEYSRLLTEYEKMRKYYSYLIAKKSRGVLTEEQLNSCKEANISKIFGYSNKVEHLAKTYRINSQKINYIISHYGSMEDFIEAYRNGELNEKDFKILKENLRLYIDIDLTENRNYDLLLKSIYALYNRESKFPILVSYSSLENALKLLTPKQFDIIKSRYGLDENSPKFQHEIAKEYNVTHQNIYQVENSILKKLVSSSLITTISPYQFFKSPEEQEKLEKLWNIIFGSNIIFYPDKEYSQEPSNIDENTFHELISYFKESKEKAELSEKLSLSIENLHLAPRVLTNLKKAGIVTISDLISHSGIELIHTAGLSEKGVNNIQNKLQNLDLSLKEDYVADTIKDVSMEVEPQKSDVILSLDIGTLYLSNKGYNLLRKFGVSTIGDLIALSKQELVNIPGMGTKTMNEIQTKLNDMDLHLLQIDDISALDQQSKEIMLTRSIDALNLSNPTSKALKAAKILTIGDLVQLSSKALMKIRGLGKISVNEIQFRLQDAGFSLLNFAEEKRLEDVRNKKAELEFEIKNLEKRTREAKKLLASYEKILNNDRNNSQDFKDR